MKELTLSLQGWCLWPKHSCVGCALCDSSRQLSYRSLCPRASWSCLVYSLLISTGSTWELQTTDLLMHGLIHPWVGCNAPVPCTTVDISRSCSPIWVKHTKYKIWPSSAKFLLIFVDIHCLINFVFNYVCSQAVSCLMYLGKVQSHFQNCNDFP